MESVRKMSKVWKSKPTIEGAGVHLKRAFGYYQVPLFDPFLMLDDFHSNYPPDYLKRVSLASTPADRDDNLRPARPGGAWRQHGEKGVIETGDVQWMTAGSGIIHQEMPKGDDVGLMWGFQFGANLPASHKMIASRYRGITAAEIPEVVLKGEVRAKVICGEVGGVRGPAGDVVIDPAYLDVTVPPETTFRYSNRRGLMR